MEKDRDLRYQTAAELRADLKRLKRDTDSARLAAVGAAASPGTSAGELGRAASVPAQASKAQPPSPAVSAGPSKVPPYLWLIIAATAVIVGILLAIDVGGLRERLSGGKPAGYISSIAVLPLVNMSKDPNTEYLSDGITESLIDDLSQIPGLRVMAPSTIFTYKNQTVDPRKVGHDLNVAAVLERKVNKMGDTLLIETDLVSTADDTELWGEQYNRKMADVLAVQADISQEIVNKLRLRLTGDEAVRLAKHKTENPEAYQLYLEGLYNSMKFSRAGLIKGEEYFERALAIDPNYADAYDGLAHNYAIAEDWVFPPLDVMPRAEAAAKKAVQLDDTSGDAHANLAYAYFFFDYNFPAAEKEFQRAVELTPSDSYAHEMYGWYLVAMGRPEQGMAENEQARNLDPLAGEPNMLLGQTLYYAHRYDQAIEQLHTTLAVAHNLWVAHDPLGWSYEARGELPQAIAEYEEARQLEPMIAEPLASLGRAYALQGRRAEALKVVSELEDFSNYNQIPPYNLVMVYSALGDKDRAIASLEKAYKERSWYIVLLAVDPKVDNLRSDPRFADLLRRIGLSQ